METREKLKRSKVSDKKEQIPVDHTATGISSSSSSSLTTYASISGTGPLLEVKDFSTDFQSFFDRDINNLFVHMKGFVSDSIFRNRADDRNNHSLVRNTCISFGDAGKDIKKLAELLKIRVTEDVGSECVVTPLANCFKDRLDDLSVRNDRIKLEAVNALSSLVLGLTGFHPAPTKIIENDYAFIFVSFHYLKHVQKHLFGLSYDDYCGSSRIRSDQKGALINQLKAFNTPSASELFLGLIEKMLEKVVLKISEKSNGKELLAQSARTFFFSMPKAVEKSYPVQRRVILSAKAKKRLGRNPKAKPTVQEQTLVESVSRPVLDPKKYTTEREKSIIKRFNAKLNSLSSFVPEINSADGRLRLTQARDLVRAMQDKARSVNHRLAARKQKVHDHLKAVSKRKIASLVSDDEKKLEARREFTPKEWEEAFESIDKSDFEVALVDVYGTADPDKLNLRDMCRYIWALPPISAATLASSLSEEDDEELVDNNNKEA